MNTPAHRCERWSLAWGYDGGATPVCTQWCGNERRCPEVEKFVPLSPTHPARSPLRPYGELMASTRDEACPWDNFKPSKDVG